jgi:hypothetical protein
VTTYISVITYKSVANLFNIITWDYI